MFELRVTFILLIPSSI